MASPFGYLGTAIEPLSVRRLPSKPYERTLLLPPAEARVWANAIHACGPSLSPCRYGWLHSENTRARACRAAAETEPFARRPLSTRRRLCYKEPMEQLVGKVIQGQRQRGHGRSGFP